MFTDGSATDPTNRELTLAAWAVVAADLHAHTFVTVADGGVPGIQQTSLRAEATAAITALKIALKHKAQTTLWVDNETVCNRIQLCLRSAKVRWDSRHKDHDLWTTIQALVQSIRRQGIPLACKKVRAHQDEEAYPEMVEKWAIHPG